MRQTQLEEEKESPDSLRQSTTSIASRGAPHTLSESMIMNVLADAVLKELKMPPTSVEEAAHDQLKEDLIVDKIHSILDEVAG